MTKPAAAFIPAALVLAAGCSQHLYAPPTQVYALDPVHATPAGSANLDLEASSHAQIFDPAFEAASARVRTGVGDNADVSLEAMTGALVAAGDASTANRHLYSGRAGFRVNPNHDAFTFSAGAGGGYAPAGGSFVALDGGISVGYDNCYLVPIVSGSAFVSQPLDARRVDVSDMDPGTTFSTPHRTAGGSIRGGLRLSLSPSSCHAGKQVPWLTAGFDITTLVDATSDAELFGVGAGISIPL